MPGIHNVPWHLLWEFMDILNKSGHKNGSNAKSLVPAHRLMAACSSKPKLHQGFLQAFRGHDPPTAECLELQALKLGGPAESVFSRPRPDGWL